MAPPAPSQCQVAGCKYKTKENLPTHEAVHNDLYLHVQVVHILSTSATPSAVQTAAPQRTRPAQIPRPELSEDSTEQEWGHWKEKWERYKRCCLQGVEKTTIVDHLWACCTRELESSIWKEVGRNVDSEAELLNLMQKLGVRKRNILLNKVTFLDMVQEEQEPLKLYVARLKGQAAVCNFTLPKGTSDYTDQMVQHQLIRGLKDESIQEHILAYAATAEGSKMGLNTTINMAEAKERGKRETESLQRSANISRLSDYKKNVKNEMPGHESLGGDQNAEKPCGWCNKPGHGAASAAEVRRQLCPAWGKDCSKCGKKGHFGSACNSNMKEGGVDTGQLKHVGRVDGDDEARSNADEPVGVLGSLVGTGPWCGMSATSGDGGQWFL